MKSYNAQLNLVNSHVLTVSTTERWERSALSESAELFFKYHISNTHGIS